MARCAAAAAGHTAERMACTGWMADAAAAYSEAMLSAGAPVLRTSLLAANAAVSSMDA
jgi:hypothetical protein